MTLTLTHHSFEIVPDDRLVITRFEDKAFSHSCPHDTDDYRGHAERSGVGQDVDQYCLDHDIAHGIFGETMCGGESPVLRSVAVNQDATGRYPQDQLDREEEIVKLMQSYFNSYGWPVERRVWPRR